MKQPKILVTGATGKTGSAVADRLLAEDVRGTPMFVVPLLRENYSGLSNSEGSRK